ncbi:unnamed protein product [Danaus chrysippus]|uniref:(African queen) hypothetical protein n=1 Tax=Danaus chrysippus TaxID=151541 RepID=A0A8J2R5V4_9NEOP|nr:unnamed protein product [Danaus chrysippus]
MLLVPIEHSSMMVTIAVCNNADKPPESIYKAPETCPDVDYIIDYVRLLKDLRKKRNQSRATMCINAGKRPEGSRGITFDIANIRGPVW